MRSHWSDGHLYSGDRVRKLQNKHYFLIDTGAEEKVFLHLHDAECYCMEHKLDPDEVVKSGDPETWLTSSYFSKYKPVCPQGYTDCVCDPAYLKCYHPLYYKNTYGDLTPEEVAKKNCFIDDDYCYDDEDK